MGNLFSKVTAVYFSATGTNKTSVCNIAEGIDPDYEKLDLTKVGSGAEGRQFKADELVVIGAPVYGGRIYKGALERFANLKGNGTVCVVTATYGNRHYDDALLELTDFMKERGFCPIAAAALVGQHTFGEIQVGRPDENDKKEDLNFAKKVCEKYQESCAPKEVKVPGNVPYRDGGSGAKFRPSTTDACVGCGLCAKNCPENAIADDFKTIDDTKCISCFRCIRNCPVKAKKMLSKEYDEFAVGFTQKLSQRRENEYFL